MQIISFCHSNEQKHAHKHTITQAWACVHTVTETVQLFSITHGGQQQRTEKETRRNTICARNEIEYINITCVVGGCGMTNSQKSLAAKPETRCPSSFWRISTNGEIIIINIIVMDFQFVHMFFHLISAFFFSCTRLFVYDLSWHISMWTSELGMWIFGHSSTHIQIWMPLTNLMPSCDCEERGNCLPLILPLSLPLSPSPALSLSLSLWLYYSIVNRLSHPVYKSSCKIC